MGDDEANNHPETSASTPNSASGLHSATKAPKDRSCPFCGQAFTSSSLGRHLDLYIKPKNPKPADGIHDVEEIKKLRGNITRRQLRTGAKGGRGQGNNINSGTASSTNSNSAGHSRQDSNGSPAQAGRARMNQDTQIASEESPAVSPANPRYTQDSTTFNKANWQATGVINNLPPRSASRNASEGTPVNVGQAQRIQEMRRDAAGGSFVERPQYESESMWRLQEAAELGRAAEMALREVLGSLKAASKRVESRLLYDEFDFYSLSFPGLCLAILPPPTTLFSPTPFPSAESWTLTPPGQRQFEAMARFLNERAAIRRKTEPVPDSVVFKHHTHLSGAWEHWEAMPASDQTSAWQLEILRSFTRGQEKNKRLRDELQQSQQHVRHLEAEYDRLSRCQLPREYLMHPPNTIPISPAVIREVKPPAGMAEANYDTDALLDKWRTTIKASARTSRMSQAPPPPPQPTYASSYERPSKDEAYRHSLSDEFVMQGSVWNVNGPLPRHGAPAEALHDKQQVSYETPPQPGAVVGPNEEDGFSNADADADGEADEEGSWPLLGALTKRRRLNPADGHSPGVTWPSSVLNSNGKRPLASGGRNSTKILREQHHEAEGADSHTPS